MAFVLSVPLDKELKAEMEKHSEIKWVEVARQALRAKILTLQELDEIFSTSKLTEKDIEKHAKIVNKRVWERHKRALGL